MKKNDFHTMNKLTKEAKRKRWLKVQHERWERLQKIEKNDKNEQNKN